MFRSYDHHQAEKYITTLGLLNWQRIRCFIRSHITVIVYIMLRIVDTPIVTLRRRIKTHIIRYHTRNRMQTPQINLDNSVLMLACGYTRIYSSDSYPSLLKQDEEWNKHTNVSKCYE
jgi:hypothetical protein